MEEYILSGVAVVGTVFSMMARTNLRRWLGYNNIVDIGFTLAMIYLFHGTFSGVVSASFAGIVMSGALYASRATMGYERLGWDGWKLVWRQYPPQAAQWAIWKWNPWKIIGPTLRSLNK